MHDRGGNAIKVTIVVTFLLNTLQFTSHYLRKSNEATMYKGFRGNKYLNTINNI